MPESYTKPILERGLSLAMTYWAITDALYARHFPGVKPLSLGPGRSLAALSPGERALFLADDFVSLVYACGFHGYFGRTNCRDAHETACGLDLLGLDGAAALLRQALAARGVPDPVPPAYVYVYKPTDEEPAELTELSARLDQAQPLAEVYKAVIEYVRRYPEEFT